jgi:hypothetical protein
MRDSSWYGRAAMGFRHGKVVVLLAVLSSLSCGGTTPSAESPAGGGMSAADARAFIAEVQAERGTPPPAPVTTMEQLLEVLDGDQLARFESASAFVAGKPGIDAITLHAAIELSWSDGYTTVGRIVEELAKRVSSKAAMLRGQRDSGRAFGDAQAKELERAEKDEQFLSKAREALDVLAKEHLDVAVAPVNEALRQFPKDGRTYRVAAYYYLLSADWEKFDSAMAWLKEGETEDAGVQYLRALEAVRRFAIRQEARGFLRKTLELNPKLVRAQAKLVFAEEGIAERHAELKKLEALSPGHPVVVIAGPAITSEYETSASLEKARASGVSPAAPTPSSAPAPAPTAAPPPGTSPATSPEATPR